MSVGGVISQVSQAASDARMFARFAIGLPKFLRNPIRPEQCS